MFLLFLTFTFPTQNGGFDHSVLSVSEQGQRSHDYLQGQEVDNLSVSPLQTVLCEYRRLSWLLAVCHTCPGPLLVRLAQDKKRWCSVIARGLPTLWLINLRLHWTNSGGKGLSQV